MRAERNTPENQLNRMKAIRNKFDFMQNAFISILQQTKQQILPECKRRPEFKSFFHKSFNKQRKKNPNHQEYVKETTDYSIIRMPRTHK